VFFFLFFRCKNDWMIVGIVVNYEYSGTCGN